LAWLVAPFYGEALGEALGSGPPAVFLVVASLVVLAVVMGTGGDAAWSRYWTTLAVALLVLPVLVLVAGGARPAPRNVDDPGSGVAAVLFAVVAFPLAGGALILAARTRPPPKPRPPARPGELRWPP